MLFSRKDRRYQYQKRLKGRTGEMERQLPIRDIYAREILDSRGCSAVEVEILAGEDIIGTAAVSLLSSCGEERTGSEDAAHAIENINCHIAQILIGKNIFDQKEIDSETVRLDGTMDKHVLGGEIILGVSAAAARTAAGALGIPLYRYLGGAQANRMPVPVVEIMTSVPCAETVPDIQGAVIVPAAKSPFHDQLWACSRVYHEIGHILRSRGPAQMRDQESGPESGLRDEEEILRVIRDAAERAGYRLGEDMMAALDGEESGWYDAVRVDIGLSGTLTEIFAVVKKAREAGRLIEISHSGNRTADTLVSDIAVASCAAYIRAGSLCGMEHAERYNRLLRIEEQIGREIS